MAYWLSFLLLFCSLDWLSEARDLGWEGGGGSSFELFFFCELWAGERPVCETAVPRFRRSGRPISVSAAPVGPSTDLEVV